MSTKTSIKRIALVAAAALTLGGFSVITAGSANAAGNSVAWNVAVASYGAHSGSTGLNDTSNVKSATGIAGGNAVILSLFDTQTSTVNITSSGVGAISFAEQGHPTIGNAVTAATSATLTAIGGAATSIAGYSTLAFTNAASGSPLATDGLSIAVVSSVAGTQTITASVESAGSITTYTATITWGSSVTGLGASASNSAFWVQNTTCPTSTTLASRSADLTYISTSTAVVTSAPKAATGLYGCVSLRNSSGTAVNAASVTFVHSLGASSSTSNGTTPIITDTIGTASNTGVATLTAIITDGFANVITLTTPVTYYGSVKTLTLTNGTYAASYKGAAVATAGSAYASYATGASTTTTADIGVAGSAEGLLILTAKDSNGNVVDLNDGVSSQPTAFTVASDQVTTAPVAKQNVALGDSVAVSYSTSDIAKLGGNGVLVTCGNSKAEKLTITANGLDSSSAAIASSPVTFYCSGSALTVVAAAASSSVDAGAVTTLTATVTDKNGYPVGDGYSVTFAGTGAGAVAPSTSTTSNGVAGTKDTSVVNFIANGDGGSATITAIAGNYSGATSISVAGGSGAASLSLDAANAATDAANNAYDEAQNATQAASDALAAVTALSAQVGALIATVKSLAAVVAKIKAKVKA